jgi:hypothetical protein
MIAVAVAAGLLVTATIWTLQSRATKNMPSTATTEKTEKQLSIPNARKTEIASAPVRENSPPKNAQVHEKLPISRPPTPYEELLFRVAIDKRQAAMKAMRERPIDRTAALAETPKPSPPDHASAVRALLPRADVRGLTRLAAAEENLDLQEEIFAALLTRGDLPSVGAYLDFVSQRNYADRAMAALDRVEAPPVDLLFGFLRGAQTPRRLAAALVLGRIDGPETSRKLFQMVCGGVGRQEAMVALLASSGKEASHYVKLAKQDISLAGILNGAQYQYHLLSLTQ